MDEDWPTHGWPAAAYGQEKAYVERALDVFERDHSGIRVVRLRPGFVFKREAATEQRRLFGGPFLPNALIRRGLIPVVPDHPLLRLQAVHAADVGQAYRLAVTRQVTGAFNIAADPVIDPRTLADLLDARLVRVPAALLRGALAAAWRMRLVPTAPDLLDMVLRVPLMDTTRARAELGWTPEHTAVDAVRELLEGIRTGADADTPPLAAETSGPARTREFSTGVGKRP
ncbi:hypothetical protein ACIBHY_39640 [Nonomuraea sp. NPDC050547]|uniref:hypothetical protein n=1 Tax=Nonomuraea sp. NPDC050547 TaxID=3364368 RepID=UPI0037B88AC3